MPETFDPLPCGSGPTCVQALRTTYDIRISQRLGARLLALARHDVFFSPALLEAAPPGSDLERLLLEDAWMACDSVAFAEEMIGIWGRAMAEDGAIKVVAADEVPADLKPRQMSPLDGERPHLLDKGALVKRPARLAVELGDARRLQDAAVAFFDSEDPSELLEKLRFLFRAAMASALDPLPVLVCALRRNKLPLALEVASLVRQHLDRDTGRALDDICHEDKARTRDAVHFLLHASGPLSVLVLPALTPWLKHPQTLRHALRYLSDALPLMPNDPDVMEPFLDALLDPLTALESPERFILSRFLVRLQERFPALDAYLFRRLGATADPQVQAFYANILARLQLDGDERERLTAMLVRLFGEHGNDVALAERLKATSLHLGPEPLARLTDAAMAGGETPYSVTQRSYIVDLWVSYLNLGVPHPPIEQLARFLAIEVASRNRAALLGMIRAAAVTDGKVDLLALPQLSALVQKDETLRLPVIAVLLEESVHLEAPDDQAVMRFLSGLGEDAMAAAFERARDEAALGARAAPYRFRVFASVAAYGVQRDGGNAPSWLLEVVTTALGWPFLRTPDLPVTLQGLGLISRVPGVGEEALLDILSLLLPEKLDDEVKFAQARVHAAIDMYGGAQCPASVRERIEMRFEAVLSAPQPPRAFLVATLDALETLLGLDRPPLRIDSMAVLLARVVLQRSRETSLDKVLAEMLRDDTEGEGVRVPEAWGKDDRDRALVILGKAASHAHVSDTLHRMITARLVGFLEDWLDAHERGDNLYLHRDTPLWRILLEIVEKRPSPHAVEAVVMVGLRTLEVARKAAANLALDRREDVQRLLAHLLWLAPQEPVEVRGSLALDMPKTALQTLITLATHDNESALRVLCDIRADARVPARLRPQLETFLSYRSARADLRPGGNGS